MSPRPPAPDLMFLLSWATHALGAEYAVGLAELGISQRAFCVLTAALPGGRTQRQLGEMCGVDKTTMVVTLDELERAGLAERHPAPTDRRARIVAVTEAGEKVVRRATEVTTRIQADVLAGLPAEDRAAFLRVLEELVQGRLGCAAPCEAPVRRQETGRLRTS
ncbi:MAG TPA: MarR family winged helix-turn-helix transcriptional regulator [Pilimelia sp.]|nr:MarR family winged helix-turn-helix transcriptional regulator [Pilimelia sp.]